MQIKYKISLIRLNEKHFPLFYKWWNDQALRKLTSEDYSPITKDEINKILNQHLLNKNAFDFIIYADNKPIGHLILQKKNGNKYYEIYIAIGEKNYWNKGIGTIAMTKAHQWFFKKFKKEKLIKLNVLTNNSRAISCYQGIGYRKIRIVHSKHFSDTILMYKYRK